MKAYNLHGINDLRYEEVPEPVLNQDTVLVNVRACGICGSDIPRVYKNGTYHFPTIIGHEFSGEVVKISDDAIEETKKWLGKHVGIFPLIPCFECAQCKEKKYEMCEHYSYLGSREDGGFAEYVRVPVWNLIELPETVQFEQAAMLEPMSVAVHAIRRCMGQDIFQETAIADENNTDANVHDGIDKNVPITICGMGTIGHFVKMFLDALGFSNVKCFKRGEVPEENTFEYFFDCAGTPETVSEGFLAVKPGGHLQLIGNPSGDMTFEKNVYWKILRKQLTVTGTWNSSFTHSVDDDWHIVLAMLSSGKIHPEELITHRFSFENGALIKGFELMRDKKEPFIKVMGINNLITINLLR